MLTFFAIVLLLSCLIGYLGRNKKLGFWGFLFASLLLTPLLGLLLLIVCKPADPPPPCPQCGQPRGT